MAEGDPRFVDRLRGIFSDTLSRREHDYTDTHAYADQFVQEVVRLLARRTARDAVVAAPENVGAPVRSSSEVIAPENAAVAVFQIFHVSGIWSVTKDNRFYGHYLEQQPAFHAVEEASIAIVANGDSANVVWNDRSSEGSIGAIRTMEYRPGSRPVLR
jgi:hypothetical protein